MCPNGAQELALIVNDDPTATRRGQRSIEGVSQRAALHGDGATTMQHLGLDRDRDPVRLDPAERAPICVRDQDPTVVRGVGCLPRRCAELHAPLLRKSELGGRLETESAVAAVTPDEISHEVINGMGQQVCRVGQLGELAADPQNGNLVSKLDGLLDVMSDEHDGLAQIALQTQELVLQLFAHNRIHRAERFVHEHDRGVRGKGSRDAHTLLLATGELCRIPRREARRQAHHLEQLKGPGFGLALVPSDQPRDGGDVRDDSAVGEEPRMLDDIADAAAQLGFVHLRRVLVVDPDPAAGGLDHPVDHPQRRRLATPGRPHEDGDLAGRSLERQLIHSQGAIRILLRDRVKPDHADKPNRDN